jgi:hypothetical protein
MSNNLKDGIYTFKAGDALPDWCSFSPGAKIERGGIKCHIYNGKVGEWEILDNTKIEGGYYLYGKGKEVGKIHIKEKRRITKASKAKLTLEMADKKLTMLLFLLLAFLIFVIAFIVNNT